MIRIHHLAPLTEEEIMCLNLVGWDGTEKFARRADVGSGDVNAIKAAWEKHEYRFVADVFTDDLEEAFRLTNHIDSDWTQGSDVNVREPGSHRSTSVGDIMEKDGRYYLVAGIGFTEINL